MICAREDLAIPAPSGHSDRVSPIVKVPLRMVPWLLACLAVLGVIVYLMVTAPDDESPRCTLTGGVWTQDVGGRYYCDRS